MLRARLDAKEVKNVSLKYESNHYGPDGEFITTKMATEIDLGIETRLTDIAKFTREAKKIFNRAVRDSKSNVRYEIELCSAVYLYRHSETDEFTKVDQISFDAWKAESDDQDFQDGVQFYFRPDPWYTKETRDLLVKDLFEANI